MATWSSPENADGEAYRTLQSTELVKFINI